MYFFLMGNVLDISMRNTVHFWEDHAPVFSSNFLDVHCRLGQHGQGDAKN